LPATRYSWISGGGVARFRMAAINRLARLRHFRK
jgi:hypothetical protein